MDEKKGKELQEIFVIFYLQLLSSWGVWLLVPLCMGVPPGARFDPIGPPGVPGFEPNRFA
ncbi:putative proteasome inhibitor, partial [Trifolium medium]|nr:putative proteasome inhibitor [Trifolium medium]